ncbi:Rhomboid family protein [Waddlia chondrophila 2032/99]|uniref:Rhomboid family protein n=2 Tax=Waddlia chondrophila TaxID=71667 RepID=D6YRU8_WADCW|nr:rhomboid family intramembrane serine protease [Waddlia chondrophila]ADI38793.1 Rhomboid family protein [Waddlia chondrophila WSU 86-1044]CCB90980.1 Rhomboid family protein [Waddlia chondrophila 2032/99]
MRLLHTFNNDRTAQEFSHFLKKEGVDNKLEISSITDWGSDDYGTLKCLLWIIDEDDVDEASKWLEEFLANPGDPKFKEGGFTPEAPPPKPQIKFKTKNIAISAKERANKFGVLTLYLILFCTVIFFATQTTKRPLETPPANFPLTPLFSSPIKKHLLYDYPATYEMTDKLVKAYGFDRLFEPQTLPPEGRYLLTQMYKIPMWHGFYPIILDSLKQGKALTGGKAPLFEKIREGEVWRLFTPILLHADIFHLFFNMIWLLVLGVQMEKRLGIFRMILFILISAAISNTAQYLMSGPDFIGFSGVLCGMIVFVWIRQKNAPWEGYHLQSSTMAFISIFVGAMAGIQLISFALELMGQPSLAPPIANTAHLSGALAGLIMAKVPFFSWKT